MAHLNSKICILGDFAVGKTSTVERFVNQQFSDKYLTTIGVKVDTCEMAVGKDINLKLIIWDVAGTDRFGPLELAYLRGASGYIFVADGTRAQTIDAALELKVQAEERYGELPFVFLLNKSDLVHSWDVSDERHDELTRTLPGLFVTSAKSGSRVDEAMTALGEMIVNREVS